MTTLILTFLFCLVFSCITWGLQWSTNRCLILILTSVEIFGITALFLRWLWCFFNFLECLRNSNRDWILLGILFSWMSPNYDELNNIIPPMQGFISIYENRSIKSWKNPSVRNNLETAVLFLVLSKKLGQPPNEIV